MPDDDGDLIRLIGTFYDAVLDPDLWPVALDRMLRHFGFQLGALSAIALPGGTAVAVEAFLFGVSATYWLDA